jgi:hypothetical protein
LVFWSINKSKNKTAQPRSPANRTSLRSVQALCLQHRALYDQRFKELNTTTNLFITMLRQTLQESTISDDEMQNALYRFAQSMPAQTVNKKSEEAHNLERLLDRWNDFYTRACSLERIYTYNARNAVDSKNALYFFGALTEQDITNYTLAKSITEKMIPIFKEYQKHATKMVAPIQDAFMRKLIFAKQLWTKKLRLLRLQNPPSLEESMENIGRCYTTSRSIRVSYTTPLPLVPENLRTLMLSIASLAEQCLEKHRNYLPPTVQAVTAQEFFSTLNQATNGILPPAQKKDSHRKLSSSIVETTVHT